MHSSSLKESRSGDFGLFFGGTVCNANCPGCNVGIDVMKSEKRKPEIYTKEIFLNQIEQTFRTASERNFASVKLKYAGGEGLYMARVAASAQDEISKLARDTDLSYSQQFLTNGGLTHAYLPILKHISETHQGKSLEINTSIWGLNDNAERRRSRQLTLPHIQNGLKLLEENNLPWTLHYVMDHDSGDTLLNFIKRSLDPNDQNFLGQDWRSKPLRISLGIMRHPNPYTEKEASNTWNSIVPVFSWMRLACLNGIKIPSPYSFFDYLMRPAHDSQGNYFVVPTDRTCGTGINFAAATPSGFERCHELLGGSLKKDIKSTLISIDQINLSDPFSTLNVSGDVDKPVATALTRAFGGGGCPNDDWLYPQNNASASFGPLQYRVYAPTTLALTYNGLIFGRQKELSPVGKYILEAGDHLAWDDLKFSEFQTYMRDPVILKNARANYINFFSTLSQLQPPLVSHQDQVFVDKVSSLARDNNLSVREYAQAVAACCTVWNYVIDRLDAELAGQIYQDIELASDFRSWITNLSNACQEIANTT